MNAARFARQLQQRGLTIKGSTEGDESVDGAVEVTALVHVQIPTFGCQVNVVVESADGTEFEFYPERAASDLDGILADVRKACGFTT